MRDFPPPAIDAAIERLPRRRKIFEALRTCAYQHDLFKCDGCGEVCHAVVSCSQHKTGFRSTADGLKGKVYCLGCCIVGRTGGHK